jgi:hypothetical protein
MGPVAQGILIGAANTFVIALGLAVVAGEAAVAVMVMMLGVVPGTALGAVLGWTAKVTKAHDVWLRRVLLTVPSIMLVGALASEFALNEYIFVSCIPTVVAAFVLERGTREVPAPPVPIARKL